MSRILYGDVLQVLHRFMHPIDEVRLLSVNKKMWRKGITQSKYSGTFINSIRHPSYNTMSDYNFFLGRFSPIFINHSKGIPLPFNLRCYIFFIKWMYTHLYPSLWKYAHLFPSISSIPYDIPYILCHCIRYNYKKLALYCFDKNYYEKSNIGMYLSEAKYGCNYFIFNHIASKTY